MNVHTSEERAYHELCAYTLQHPDQKPFIHQHVVDAYAAQTANDESKSVGIVFALAGLYLHVEKGYTGKQVQRAHMQMAKARKDWPRLQLPKERGAKIAAEVMLVPEGVDRDAAIERWSREVWAAWREQHAVIAQLVTAILGDLSQSGVSNFAPRQGRSE